MTIRMYKTLFPYTSINEVNKSINKNIVLHTYHNPCTPYIDICRVTINNAGINL